MTGCIEWTRYRNKKGYGVASNGKGRTMLAHRKIWIEVNGPIPHGLCVLHRCDNPGCVNIDHLFLGTNADNVQDRVTKQRSNRPKGERNPFARLTLTQVEEIRSMHGPHRLAAERFNVCVSTVSHIRTGRSW